MAALSVVLVASGALTVWAGESESPGGCTGRWCTILSHVSLSDSRSLTLAAFVLSVISTDHACCGWSLTDIVGNRPRSVAAVRRGDNGARSSMTLLPPLRGNLQRTCFRKASPLVYDTWQLFRRATVPCFWFLNPTQAPSRRSRPMRTGQLGFTIGTFEATSWSMMHVILARGRVTCLPRSCPDCHVVLANSAVGGHLMSASREPCDVMSITEYMRGCTGVLIGLAVISSDELVGLITCGTLALFVCRGGVVDHCEMCSNAGHWFAFVGDVIVEQAVTECDELDNPE